MYIFLHVIRRQSSVTLIAIVICARIISNVLGRVGLPIKKDKPGFEYEKAEFIRPANKHIQIR
jgi:hypothetical protein